MIKAAVRFIDQRTGTAPMIKKTLRYIFPDHWSFPVSYTHLTLPTIYSV